MRTKIKIGILLLMTCCTMCSLYAQDNTKYQAYYIHEDPVNTSMVTPYEKLATDLVANCKKINLQEGWLTLAMDDYHYIYVSPIKDMADLDKNTFAPLQEKMGKEAFGKMFDDFDKCYNSHRDYIVVLNKELSYMPGGININPEGTPYRRFTYYYITPQNFAEAREIVKSFHDLYEKKGSKFPYRLYRSGFGEKENYYLVVEGAKDAADYEKMNAENIKLLGDDGQALYGKWLQVISGVKNVSGTARDDLSYSPGK